MTRPSLRWPAAVAIGAATLIAATVAGAFPGITVTLAWTLAALVLIVWRPT